MSRDAAERSEGSVVGEEGTRRRHRRLAALTALIAVLLLEAGSWALLLVADRGFDLQIRRTPTLLAEHQDRARAFVRATDTREVLDPILGWTNRPGWADAEDRVNGGGLRADREFTREIPPGTVRLAAFGDSFVYGTEVDLAAAWSQRLPELCPGVEVLNFGVRAYGTDQAYLRFLHEANAWEMDRVLIGFAPVDVQRAVNVYRPFIHDQEWPWVKPRFRLSTEGALEALPNPLPTRADYARLVDETRATVLRLGEHDHWFRPWIWRNPLYDLSATVRLVSYMGGRVYNDRLRPDRLLRDGTFNPRSEPYRVQRALLEAFHRVVEEAGLDPLVVVFPDEWALEPLSRGEDPNYGPLIRELTGRGIPVLDLAEGFLIEAPNGPWAPYFAPGSHYSELGNEVVARRLCQELMEEESS